MSSLAKGAKQTAKGPSKLVLKLPAGWAEKQDQAGRTYYWNSETGESQWFPPPMAAKSADTVRTLIIQHNFKAADKDGSGTISKSELGLMLRRITPEMSLKEVEEMHKSMDADMDGKVSFAEFNTWLLSDKQKQLAARLTKNVSSPASAVSATFRIWDTDDSGKLTRAEITSVLQKAIPHITEECLQNIFSELDTDRKPVCMPSLCDHLGWPERCLQCGWGPLRWCCRVVGLSYVCDSVVDQRLDLAC